MRCIRDILRLHFIQGQSPRQIAKSQGCGRTSIQRYLAVANKNQITWEIAERLSDAALEERLGFKTSPIQWTLKDRPMPDWSRVHEELSKNKNVTLLLLWQEYLDVHPNGYRYTRFTEHYKAWAKKLSVVMRQNHVAGEKCFVDYCDGIVFTDPKTGAEIKTQLFVGCLGASSYTFAEVTRSQALPDWLMSHVRMFEFFGGVAALTITDNLKSAVKKPCYVEPEINESYRDLAHHYSTTILPAHVRKPRHKAKVEVNVLVAQRWILACLRHRKFSSLEEINEAILPLLEKLNQRVMRHLKKSRRELYEALDLPALKKLPPDRYVFSEWKKAKVNIDYHIQFDDHFYSAHFTHVHKEVMVRATAATIEVFLKGERIASHHRSHLKYKHTTKPEHMPEAHKSMAKFPPSRLISWGKSIGSSVGILVEKILSLKLHPEQAYRSALGVIRLERKYGKERLEVAATRALELQSCSYGFVSKMLASNMDLQITKRNEKALEKKSESNTRGAGYYH